MQNQKDGGLKMEIEHEVGRNRKRVIELERFTNDLQVQINDLKGEVRKCRGPRLD